jgi:putative transposase
VIDRPDQVWASDITYIRLLHGFVYLVVIMDWFSRYVLSWELSTTLEKKFCLEALGRALMVSTLEIFNSDQGAQFTSEDFIGILKDTEIRICMDGRGRFYDNIFVERLWRTVKYEEVYLNDYVSVPVAREGLGDYFGFYSTERPHASLAGKTPFELYYGVSTARVAGIGQRV